MHRARSGPSMSANSSSAQAPRPDITSGPRPKQTTHRVGDGGRHVGLAERPSLIEVGEPSGAGPCTSRSAGPGLASGQPRSRDYGRYRSRSDARSQRRPGSKPRASMPAHASRTRAPAPSAPPSRAERRLLAPVRPRHRPASAATPAELSASPAARPVKLRSVDSGLGATPTPARRAPAAGRTCWPGRAAGQETHHLCAVTSQRVEVAAQAYSPRLGSAGGVSCAGQFFSRKFPDPPPRLLSKPPLARSQSGS